MNNANTSENYNQLINSYIARSKEGAFHTFLPKKKTYIAFIDDSTLNLTQGENEAKTKTKR